MLASDAASLLLLRLLVCVERVVVVGGRARVVIMLYVEVELECVRKRGLPVTWKEESGDEGERVRGGPVEQAEREQAKRTREWHGQGLVVHM